MPKELPLMFDYQSAFNLAFTLSAFLAGWVLSGITKAIDRLDADIRRMPVDYVTKTDYHIDLRDIKELLQRIDVKLDGKADK
jgi:hypothetical protein